eukprot:TRINITY_DN27247_c0_g1_i1.p1 TRINITY_DN27247_c0_g1~~TRINITY_DN27247_c0_g1_i1.p1  ORF type:complete len:334 (+),score=30.49 TRINITY_DN27247_c0_g1_i1:122-1123(+)
MSNVTSGLPYVAGAIFCWGTALIFLKIRCVVSRKIPGTVMSLYYSFGYLLAASTGAVFLVASGHSFSISAMGIVGGSLWGVGKVLTIFAVTGALGLATGQAMQCAANVLTNFVANAIIRGDCMWEQVGGVFLLLLGLVTLTVPRMGESTPGKHSLPLHVQEHVEISAMTDGASSVAVAANESEKLKMMTGVALALGSGVFMGVQAVPFRLSEGSDPWEYVINESFGQFVVILLSCGGVVLSDLRKKTLPDLSWRQGVPAGLAGGSLLFAAAAFNTLAVAEMGLLAGCLSQLNMIVAGLWGILFFREMHGVFAITLFFLGAAFALAGAALVVAK